MKIGVAIPQYEVDRAPGGDPTVTVSAAVAGRAEALGLDGVWVSDHAYAVAPDGTVSGALEPFVLLAAIARGTSRVELGTLVLAATMRTPKLVAHAARSLAPGRLVVGVGAGWHAAEHRTYGVALGAYDDRVDRVEATLDALHAIGQGRPATLAGGSGERLLQVAARRADVWNVAWDPDPDAFAALSRRLDRACERAGRDPATLRRSVGLTVLVGADDRAVSSAVERLRGRAPFLRSVDRDVLETKIIVGTPVAVAERIALYEADEIIAALLLRDDPEMLELFATEVVPAIR